MISWRNREPEPPAARLDRAAATKAQYIAEYQRVLDEIRAAGTIEGMFGAQVFIVEGRSYVIPRYSFLPSRLTDGLDGPSVVVVSTTPPTT